MPVDRTACPHRHIEIDGLCSDCGATWRERTSLSERNTRPPRPAIGEPDLSWLDELLHGIDCDESTDDGAWWSTSTGATFGAGKLAELKAEITRRYHQSPEPAPPIAPPGELLGYSVAYLTPAGRWQFGALRQDHARTVSLADTERMINDEMRIPIHLIKSEPALLLEEITVVEIRRKP